MEWPNLRHALLPEAWACVIQSWLEDPKAQALLDRIREREGQGHLVLPAEGLRLRALELTPIDAVRVVILGQDPYHGVDSRTGLPQAQGLAFSVEQGARCPPSLRNIFLELERETGLRRTNTCLEDWARQGVLLLNTILTVELDRPVAHAKWGWESVTDALIQALVQQASESLQPVVFMLWGAYAQQKVARLTQSSGQKSTHAKAETANNILILRSNHPSPLAANRPPIPFLGNNHFVTANAFLQKHGAGAINWI